MDAQNIPLWGRADLRDFATPQDGSGKTFDFALSFALPMGPGIMAGIQKGPNREYAHEYARVNQRINDLSAGLAKAIRDKGLKALALPASKRTDKVNIRGDFPQKTAATQAGLGWIGKNCQLITRSFGPWVRLGCVFTDLDLRPCGPARQKSLCGRCRRCIDACPARALKGNPWYPGRPRNEILDVRACDQWKKTHYFQYHKGHNCGICSAVCPHGLKGNKKA